MVISNNMAELIPWGFAGIFVVGMVGSILYEAIFRPPYRWQDLLFSSRTRINYDDPLYPWKRWTWTKTPENWQKARRNREFWALVFLGPGILFACTGFLAAATPLVFMGLMHLIIALRIDFRVRKLRGSDSQNAQSPPTQT